MFVLTQSIQRELSDAFEEGVALGFEPCEVVGEVEVVPDVDHLIDQD